MTTTGKNRIMIYGPKDDGTYVVDQEALRMVGRKSRLNALRLRKYGVSIDE